MLPYIQTINDRQQRVWVNTLWADLCAGHHDDRAVEDPDANWGWVIAQGADILQTDRPELMLEEFYFWPICETSHFKFFL